MMCDRLFCPLHKTSSAQPNRRKRALPCTDPKQPCQDTICSGSGPLSDIGAAPAFALIASHEEHSPHQGDSWAHPAHCRAPELIESPRDVSEWLRKTASREAGSAFRGRLETDCTHSWERHPSTGDQSLGDLLRNPWAIDLMTGCTAGAFYYTSPGATNLELKTVGPCRRGESSCAPSSSPVLLVLAPGCSAPTAFDNAMRSTVLSHQRFVSNS